MSAEQKIVLASSNKGKLAELENALSPLGFSVLPQSEFNCTDAIEDGLSFIENAIKKARHASAQTNLPALADDSGLEVVALNGQPGIYSARYAGEHGNDAANNAKLLEDMQASAKREQRQASFRCVLALVRHQDDPTPIIAEGIWAGELLSSPSGDNGFGYDPLFYVPELNCSAAELTKEQKKQVSHRAKALAALQDKLSNLQQDKLIHF